MGYPPVIVVDQLDRPVDLAMLAEVWEKGLYHRIVRIMVEDGKGNVLLQRRSSRMVIFPDTWDSSAAGHVDEGMTYSSAALQEAAEELGVTHVGLAEIGSLFTPMKYEWRIMNQFSKVYRLKYTEGLPITSDEHEVSELRWFSIAEAKQLARKEPERMTPGLHHILEQLY